MYANNPMLLNFYQWMESINQWFFFFTPLNKQCISCSSDKLVSDKLVVDDPRYNINMTMVKKKKIFAI